MIEVGRVMDCIMLDKTGGKRTGATRPVKVIDLEYHFVRRLGVRRVHVVTVDALPVRRAWVERKYLLDRQETPTP